MALQHDAAHAQHFGFRDGFGRIDASRAVRVGTVVAVHVDRADHQIARFRCHDAG